MKRFLFCLFGVGTAVGVLLGLVGALMDWSYGVNFVACALGGSAIALLTLRDNPLDWLRVGNAGRRHKRHA